MHVPLYTLGSLAPLLIHVPSIPSARWLARFCAFCWHCHRRNLNNLKPAKFEVAVSVRLRAHDSEACTAYE